MYMSSAYSGVWILYLPTNIIMESYFYTLRTLLTHFTHTPIVAFRNFNIK